MSEPRILIITPAHNEAENLPHVFAELRRCLPDTDIVVIDDYSTDDTAAVAARLGGRVVSLPCNLGYGGAVQTGFKYAVEYGYDYGVLLDADGSMTQPVSPIYWPLCLLARLTSLSGRAF
jgi:glycosyltransferase involved in cell wall biosynthesis